MIRAVVARGVARSRPAFASESPRSVCEKFSIESEAGGELPVVVGWTHNHPPGNDQCYGTKVFAAGGISLTRPGASAATRLSASAPAGDERSDFATSR